MIGFRYNNQKTSKSYKSPVENLGISLKKIYTGQFVQYIGFEIGAHARAKKVVAHRFNFKGWMLIFCKTTVEVCTGPTRIYYKQNTF